MVRVLAACAILLAAAAFPALADDPAPAPQDHVQSESDLITPEPPTGEVLERMRQTPDATICDTDSFDGFQRNCHLALGTQPTHAQRLMLLSMEGRLVSWTGDKPQTADAPFAFRGWWIEPGKSCEAWGDDSQLRIGVNLAQFYAGEGRIQSVREIGPDEIEMVLDMHTDPADAPTVHLKLSPDHSRLTEINVDNSFDRVRCDGWP